MNWCYQNYQTVLFFIFWWVFKQFSSERSNGYHHSILGLWCHLLPRMGFMGRFTAEDVLQTCAGISKLEQSIILQVASDGPNLNLPFLKNLTEPWEEKRAVTSDIGRYGLHVISNSFKTGAKKGSDSELQKLLKATWKFLKEPLTRTSLYENVSEPLVYPLHSCGQRWCENKESAERAEMILEGYCKFIAHTCSLKKSQQPNYKNKSFQYLKSIIHCPLLPAKLNFFEMVPSKHNAFLRGFQTNKPMVPFVADTLGDLVCDFFGRIIL